MNSESQQTYWNFLTLVRKAFLSFLKPCKKAGALHLTWHNCSSFFHPWTKWLCSLHALLFTVYDFNYSFHHFLWLLTACYCFARFFHPIGCWCQCCRYFTSGLYFCSIYTNDKSYTYNMLLRIEFSGVNYIPCIM